MRRLSSIISILTALALPHVARAQGIGKLADTILGYALEDILEGWLTFINIFVWIASFFMGLAMGWIGAVMEWQVASNNEVVLVSWAMARDISNIFFIVGLILISFATMFRTFGVMQSFHWKSALPRLLMAAILVNLSLAMSQTVVLVSNQVTNIMGGILENSGFELSRILKTNTLQKDLHVILSNDRALALQLSGATPDQQAQFNTPEVQEAIAKCQEQESQKNQSFWQNMVDKVPRMAIGVAAGPLGFIVAASLPVTSLENIDTGGVRKTIQECTEEFVASSSGLVQRAAIATSSLLQWAGVTPASTQIYLIMMSLLNLLFVVMVLISLGSAIVFYMFRVMAIWVLLFFSAFAFGFSWIPGAQSLKKWWNIFLGWNVFGPMYLFFLIIGMSFLVRQGDLVAALEASPDVGIVGGLFQIIFFYIFAALIFVGGLMIALNSSFAAAVKSTPLIGGAAEKVGAFSAVAWSTAFGKRALQATRAPAYFQAARERAAQEYRERRPEFLRLKTQEEMTAAARARLGVQGGAAELNTLRTKRLKDVSGRLDKALDGFDGIDPKTGEYSAGLQHNQKMDYLRSRMNSRNKDEAIASRQQLLKYGDSSMTIEEIKKTQKLLPGGVAQAEFAKNMKTGDVDPLKQYQWFVAQNPNKPPGEAAESFFGNILRDPNKFKKLSPAYADPNIPGGTYSAAVGVMKGAADRIWDPASTDPKDQRARHNAKVRLIRAADTPQKRELVEQVFTP